MHSTNLFVVADADYARDLKAKFLADATPAESFAAGANALSAASGIGSYNFQSETPNGWPESRKVLVGNKIVDIWKHSDLKNVAYYYVHSLFGKILGGE